MSLCQRHHVQEPCPVCDWQPSHRASALLDLIHHVGKVATEMGEAWRMAHPELMDAYEAVQKELAGWEGVS